MERTRRPQVLLALGLTLFGATAFHSLASAQAAPPSAPAAASQFKNLQVLPATITRDQLFGTMKGFASSLGVRCTHCHVGEEGKPLSTFDFASDAKREKRIARAMMRMTRSLNQDTLPKIAELKDAKVTCYTCHRGAVKPATAAPSAPPPPAPAPQKG